MFGLSNCSQTANGPFQWILILPLSFTGNGNYVPHFYSLRENRCAMPECYFIYFIFWGFICNNFISLCCMICTKTHTHTGKHWNCSFHLTSLFCHCTDRASTMDFTASVRAEQTQQCISVPGLICSQSFVHACSFIHCYGKQTLYLK